MESEVLENDDCVLKVQRIWRIPKGHKSNSSLGRRDEALSSATIGPHTWTPAGFCVLLVFYDHFFFSPFNPSGQQVNDKTTKIQEYYHWDG